MVPRAEKTLVLASKVPSVCRTLGSGWLSTYGADHREAGLRESWQLPGSGCVKSCCLSHGCIVES
jgi:hypothetical protein